VVAVDLSRSPGNSLLSIVLNFVVVDEEGAEEGGVVSAFATNADGEGEEEVLVEVHVARKAQTVSNCSFFWSYPPPL
jgi:hypothetical protein